MLWYSTLPLTYSSRTPTFIVPTLSPALASRSKQFHLSLAGPRDPHPNDGLKHPKTDLKSMLHFDSHFRLEPTHFFDFYFPQFLIIESLVNFSHTTQPANVSTLFLHRPHPPSHDFTLFLGGIVPKSLVLGG